MSDNKKKYIRGEARFSSIQRLLIVVMCVIVFVLVSIPGLLNAKRSVWEAQAKDVLKAYGETQTAYSRTNLFSQYGTWDALQRNGFIEDGFTEENIVENYYLHTEVPVMSYDG